MGSGYTEIRGTPGDDDHIGAEWMSIQIKEFDKLTERSRQLKLLLTERDVFIKMFTTIEAMPDNWAPIMRTCAREAVFQAARGLENEVNVVRVSGGMICSSCGKEFRDHPYDPDCPWPTFVLLCDGTHAKV